MNKRPGMPKRSYTVRPMTQAAPTLIKQFLDLLELSGMSDADLAEKVKIRVRINNWRQGTLPDLSDFANCLAWLGYTLVPTNCGVRPNRASCDFGRRQMTKPVDEKKRHRRQRSNYVVGPRTAPATTLMEQFIYRLKLSGMSDADLAKKAKVSPRTINGWYRGKLPGLGVIADCIACLGYTLVPTKCDVHPENNVFEIVDPLWLDMERQKDRENGIDVGPEPGSSEWERQNSIGDDDDLSPTAEDIERERCELQIPLETRQRRYEESALKKKDLTKRAEREADKQDERQRAIATKKRANKEKMNKRLARWKSKKSGL